MLKSKKPPPASDVSGVGGEESHLRERKQGGLRMTGHQEVFHGKLISQFVMKMEL